MASHFPILLLASAVLAGCAVVPGPVGYRPAYEPAYSATVYPAPPIEYRAAPPRTIQIWGLRSWQREDEHRRSPGGQPEPHHPLSQVRPRFEEPERGWRGGPSPALRHESPQYVQPQPRRAAPPVIHQSEPGRAGFMRGLTERAQTERIEPAPRPAEAGRRHPPEPGRRSGHGRLEEGEASDRH